MAKVIDVVCGMEVDTETAADTSVYRDTTFYFCSSDCKRQFDQEPERYLEAFRDNNDGLVTPVVPLVPPVAGSGNTPLR